ncbi:MAG: 30S ribosomal protein S20 [Candidatus Aureabacteria bacterium]|nr:30S ribosomal protein S20 [Candidatus Auribacterota bacterium]
MPTRKSGAKHMRADIKKGLRNARVISALKTLKRKFELLTKKGDREGAAKLFLRLSSACDKAAKRGIIHKNNANRTKARLSKRLKA